MSTPNKEKVKNKRKKHKLLAAKKLENLITYKIVSG